MKEILLETGFWARGMIAPQFFPEEKTDPLTRGACELNIEIEVIRDDLDFVHKISFHQKREAENLTHDLRDRFSSI